jgi:hypothetical protein
MKANRWALALSLAAVSLAGIAKADTGYYATANIAQASCGTDAVVWVDLDRGRYYQIGQGDSMKSGNGIYACEKAAHAKYRAGKSEATAVATKQ